MLGEMSAEKLVGTRKVEELPIPPGKSSSGTSAACACASAWAVYAMRTTGR